MDNANWVIRINKENAVMTLITLLLVIGSIWFFTYGCSTSFAFARDPKMTAGAIDLLAFVFPFCSLIALFHCRIKEA